MESISSSYVTAQNLAAVNAADATSQAQAQQDIADLNTAIQNAQANLFKIQSAANQAALEGVDLSSEVQAAQETLGRAQADYNTATAFLNDGILEGNPEFFDAVASLTGPDITALNNLATVASQAQATAASNAPNPNDQSQLSRAQSLSSAAVAQSAKDLSILQGYVNAHPGNSFLASLLSNATTANTNAVNNNGIAQDNRDNGYAYCISNANSAVSNAAYVRTTLEEAIASLS